MEFIDYLALYWLFIKIGIYFTVIVLFVSGIDDLFVDLFYWIRKLYRAVFIRRKYPPLPLEKLLDKEEIPLALMVPAWDEAVVIEKMLQNTIKTFQYTNYHIFVGTYPNDLATQEKVDNVIKLYPNIHKVVNKTPGPTSKADCLNNVIERVFNYEKEQGIFFKCFSYHDAEDIVHPYELKLANYLIERKDLIQIPVVPLTRNWWNFNGGHYQDEFAETGSKDMVVREALSGYVPSSGVATSFSRRAIETLSKLNNGVVFNTKSLTEDYDIGYRLLNEGLKLVFVRFPVKVKRKTKDMFGNEVEEEMEEFIVSKGYFPTKFFQAIRQKTRWIIGIVFQGYRDIGWPKGWGLRYMLYRDRKALFTHIANFIAYLLMFHLIFLQFYYHFHDMPWRFPQFIPQESWLWPLIYINGFFMLSRFFHRFLFVQQTYGTSQAFLSIPRMFWGNIINMFALFRALMQYKSAVKKKEKIAWDKTDHEFPDETETVNMK